MENNLDNAIAFLTEHHKSHPECFATYLQMGKTMVAYTNRLLALTSSGGVTDEAMPNPIELLKKYGLYYSQGVFYTGDSAVRTKDAIAAMWEFAKIYANSLRSKGKVRVLTMPTEDEKYRRSDKYCPDNAATSNGYEAGWDDAIQRVIELNKSKQTAQDGGLPTKKCGCPNDLCCDECYQINQP